VIHVVNRYQEIRMSKFLRTSLVSSFALATLAACSAPQETSETQNPFHVASAKDCAVIDTVSKNGYDFKNGVLHMGVRPEKQAWRSDSVKSFADYQEEIKMTWTSMAFNLYAAAAFSELPAAPQCKPAPAFWR
jgi:hypothetical protein